MSTENNEQDSEYEFETYEGYFGSAEDVRRSIDECEECGSKLVFTHLPDYKNLYMQENCRCLECGHVHKKTIHIMN